MNKTNFSKDDNLLSFDKLTFNLDKILYFIVRGVNFDEVNKVMTKPVASYQNFIKPKEREKFMKSGPLTSSSNLVEFLEKTLGLELDREDNNHKRNSLNLIIKKFAKTHQGKKTILDYYQFKDLILSDDFNKFVLTNFDPLKADNEEKAYQEVMFLQQNRFKTTQIYREQKQEESIAVSYALSLVNGFGDFLRSRYSLYVRLAENGTFFGDADLPDNEKELLEIISFRQGQNSPIVYKFDSEYDVNTTKDEQIIRWFLADVDAWNYEDWNRNPVN